MGAYFVYLLFVKAFVDSFKIGSTENPYNRYNSYGGYYSSEQYEMNIIEIIKLPITHKTKCKKDYNNSYHEYVEKEILHKHYKSFSVKNPSSNTNNEFFKCAISLEDIKQILINNGLQEGVHFKLRNENILDCEEYKKIARSKAKEKVKDKHINENDYNEAFIEEDIKDLFQYRWFHRWYNRVFPVKKFIETQILDNKLRDIQTHLYVEIQKKLNKGERIRDIVKWATGVGKRIGIIICILLLNEHYSKKDKPCRLVLCSHRNDIFGDKAMIDYKLLDKKGVTVIDGTKGNFKKSLEEINKCNADNRSWLLITTHQALTGTDEDISNFNNLNKDVLIYDEVQRITGDQLYKSILDNMPEHLLGFSGTPFTCDPEQNEKLLQLFGLEKEEYISQCSCPEAITKGYINNFKIHIHVLQPGEDIYGYAKDITLKTIERRKQNNMWLYKKIIHNVNSIENIKHSFNTFKDTGITRFIPEQNERSLEELQCNTNVSDFENELNENNDEILFTCQTYREGSDISGIEFVNIIIEGDKALHLIAQIKGRADRIDYPNQLSETNIFIYNKEDDTFLKLVTGLSSELDIPINYIYDYVDVVKSSSKYESESDKEVRELEEKLEKAKKKRSDEYVEKMNKDKSDLQKQMKVYLDKQKITYVSKDKFIEICSDLNIHSLKDALKRIGEINETKNMKITEADIHSLNIDWSKMNTEYYNVGDCIKQCSKIYSNDRKRFRDMKKNDRHKYYCSKDPRIPPPSITKCLGSYYGGKYSDSDFKLS